MDFYGLLIVMHFYALLCTFVHFCALLWTFNCYALLCTFMYFYGINDFYGINGLFGTFSLELTHCAT
jgi:hypothetical protein